MKKTNLGPSGVIISNVLFYGIPFSVLLSIQRSRLMSGGTGIWNK